MFSLKKDSTRACSPWPRFTTLEEYFSGFFSGGCSSGGAPYREAPERVPFDKEGANVAELFDWLEVKLCWLRASWP